SYFKTLATSGSDRVSAIGFSRFTEANRTQKGISVALRLSARGGNRADHHREDGHGDLRRNGHGEGATGRALHHDVRDRHPGRGARDVDLIAGCDLPLARVGCHVHKYSSERMIAA